MRTREDIEAYLIRSKYPHEEIEERTWLVRDPSGIHENVVLRVTEDLAIFRVKVLELPGIDVKKREQFFGALLELNANDMVHGCYGVHDDKVLLTATLRLENLDYNELVGTLDDFSVALAKHQPKLADFQKPS
jgi:hypothetical protein